MTEQEAAERRREMARELGRKGGEVTRERHGKRHYEAIGAAGGQETKRKRQEQAVEASQDPE